MPALCALCHTSWVSVVIAAIPARPRPTSRRGPRRRSCCPRARSVVPGGGCSVRTIRRAGPSWWPLALATVGLVSCARQVWRQRTCLGLAASPRHWEHERGVVGWRCVLRSGLVGVSGPGWGRAAGASGGGAAGRAGPPQPRGDAGGHHAATWSCRAWRCDAPSTSGSGVASAVLDHGAPGVVACGGQGGAHGGGGGRSLGGQAPRVSLQPPNKGLQATVDSLRSSVAPATHRA